MKICTCALRCAIFLGIVGVPELRATATQLFDPEIWYADPVGASRAYDIQYDSTTGILYEVGMRSMSLHTGEMIGSFDFYVRGHDVATGNVTIALENGTSSWDQFSGGHIAFAGLRALGIETSKSPPLIHFDNR